MKAQRKDDRTLITVKGKKSMQRFSPAGLILLLALILTACAQQSAAPAEQRLTVFAAASLTESFSAMGEAFEEANPGTTVLLNFAGSQQLANQLAQGAAADVFASANERQMTAAVEAGRVAADSPQTFTHNRLVVVLPADNPGQIETLLDLANPGVKLILAAEDVPVGAYSRAYLAQAVITAGMGRAYRDAVLANVVSYEQTVKAVLTKVALGEADAGIVYRSDIAPELIAEVQTIEIPDALNTIATYPIALVGDSEQPALAQQFIDFVLSPDGQAIMQEFGFIPLER
jgi:molybdate transport system substrate-binding protein